VGYHSFVFEPARAEAQVGRRLMADAGQAAVADLDAVAHAWLNSRRLLRLALRQDCPQLAANHIAGCQRRTDRGGIGRAPS
jgi:hypothetical protein